MLEHRQIVESILGVPLLPYKGYEVREKEGVPDIRLRIEAAVGGVVRHTMGEAAAVRAESVIGARSELWQQNHEVLTHIRRQTVIANNAVRFARGAASDMRMDQQLYDALQYPTPITAAAAVPGTSGWLRSGMRVSLRGAQRRQQEIARLLLHIRVGASYCHEDPEPIRALVAVPQAGIKAYGSISHGAVYYRQLLRGATVELYEASAQRVPAHIAVITDSRLAELLAQEGASAIVDYPVRIVEEALPFPEDQLGRLGSLAVQAIIFAAQDSPQRPALAAYFPDSVDIDKRRPATGRAAVASSSAQSAAVSSPPPAAAPVPVQSAKVSLPSVPPQAAHVPPSLPAPHLRRSLERPTPLPPEKGQWRSVEVLRQRLRCDIFTLQVLLAHLNLQEQQLKKNERGIVVAVDALAELAARQYPINPAPPLRMATVERIAHITSVTTDEVIAAIMDMEERRGGALTPQECIIGRNLDVVGVYFYTGITRAIVGRIRVRQEEKRRS